MFDIPIEVTGIQLCRVTKGGELTLCETVIFDDGVSAVELVLRRASISGKVGPIGETGDYWADLMTDEGNTCVETIALDARSYKAIKTGWARTRLQRYPGPCSRTGATSDDLSVSPPRWQRADRL